jgi:hypothetical protein
MPFSLGLRERLVVEHVGPRRVDHVGAGLQPIEHVRVDEVLRERAGRHVDGEDVALLRDLGRSLRHRDPLFDERGSARPELQQQRQVHGNGVAVDRHADLAPNREVHAEGHGSLGDLLPDLAEPEDAERRPVEPPGLRVLLLVPLPGAQLDGIVRDAPVERRHQPEGQLRDRDRVLARAVRHVDAPPRRRLHVDRVVAGAGAHDEREPARIEHRLGDHGRPDDEHLGLRPGEGLDERRVLQVGLEGDLAPRSLQPIDPALLELVGDEDFHDVHLLPSAGLRRAYGGGSGSGG